MSLVIARLMGGLGNQMFQYATGLALSRHLEVPLLLDRTFLDSRPPGMNWTPRNFELDVFQAPVTFATSAQVRAARRELDSAGYRRSARLLPGLFPERCYVQKGSAFDPALFAQEAPIYIEGFWQNEGYFANIAEELRRSLYVPRETISGRNAALLNAIRSATSASVHVRRGDYVSNMESNRYHGVCTPDYYQGTVEEMAVKHAVEHFYLFSDEPEWVQANLPLSHPHTVVSHNTGRDSHWDLHLMRHCKHHVTANSSFSWWGAWLDPSPEKVVIAPAQWFRGVQTPASDILPPEWIAR